MGAIISRLRRKETTEQILDDLQQKISGLEESKKTSIEKQKRLIGSLLLYSVLLYVLAALLFYFYYVPETWPDRLLYSLPLAIFPIIVWLAKRFLHWYFVKRISKNEAALQELKKKRKTILEEVMEKETYKKAKEILEKYDPERFKSMEGAVATPVQRTPDGQELRHRQVMRGSGPTPVAMVKGQPATVGGGVPSTPMSTPTGPRQSLPVRGMGTTQRNGTKSVFVTPGGQAYGPPGGQAPGPPLPHPVLPRDRTIMDRLVEYLVGDGPQNRYALVCRECQSHNGMALKEEFEFISFRCCYCYALNAARKKRPFAPKLESLDTPLTSRSKMCSNQGLESEEGLKDMVQGQSDTADAEKVNSGPNESSDNTDPAYQHTDNKQHLKEN